MDAEPAARASAACGAPTHALDSEAGCIFESIWSRIDSAMMLFDLGAERLLWQNAAAAKLLPGLDPIRDYHALRELLALEAAPADARPPPPPRRQQEARFGDTVVGYSVYHTSSRHAVVLLRDITEQLRLEAIAETANLMDNIGYVFSGIRHELGNPINTIKMTVSVLRRDLETIATERIAERLELVLAEIGRVEYLLASLRGFSIYDSQHLATVDLRDALDRFVHLSAADLAARDVALAVHVDEDARRALCDPRKLQQVLLNLVTNAADALEGRPAPRISIAVRVRGEQIAISVTDNGVGIPEAQLACLFRPFRTTKPKGTGLGLVIAKKMLVAMGGSIEVSSKVDAGTSVTITLPRSPSAALGAGPSPSRTAAAAARRGAKGAGS